MSTQTQTPQAPIAPDVPTASAPRCRVFKYAGKTFPDPGSEYTIEQVLNHLKGYLPELGHAKTEEKELPDGTLEITFSKQVTRKG